MIPVTPVHIFTAYVIFWLICLTAVWIHGEFKHRTNCDWSVVRERLYHCEHCHISFLASNEKLNSAHCPACGELCFISRKKHF